MDYKKVCYIISVQEKYGGLKTFNLGLVNAIAENINKTKGEFFLIVNEKYKKEFSEIPFVKIIYFKMHRLIFENLYLFSHLKRISPDLTIFPNNRVPFFFNHKSTSVIIHDLQFWRYPQNYSNFKYYFRKIALNNAILKSNKIFSISTFTKNELVKYGCEKKIKVINEGFNDEIKPIKPEIRDSIKKIKNYNFFFYIGSKSKHKNLINLIKAFTIFNDNKKFHLVLAGAQTNNKRRYLKAIENSSQKDWIIDLNQVNDSEKSFLFKNCFSFVFPSIYEGFGLPVLEAWHYEKLIIASNTGNLKYLCKEAGLLVGSSYLEILEGLNSAFHNSEEHKIFIVAGKKKLEKFTWLNTASLILQGI